MKNYIGSVVIGGALVASLISPFVASAWSNYGGMQNSQYQNQNQGQWQMQYQNQNGYQNQYQYQQPEYQQPQQLPPAQTTTS